MFAIRYETTSSTFFVKDIVEPGGQVLYTEEPWRQFDTEVEAQQFLDAHGVSGLKIVEV